jgi:hypothetical protein
MKKVTRELDFDKDLSCSFPYCGKTVKQLADGTVLVNQSETATKIPKVPLDKARKSQPDSPCTAEEISILRARNGSLGWLQRQDRPDLSFVTSQGQTACNKAIGKAHAKHDMELKFVAGKLNWNEAEVILSRDAAHANARDLTFVEGTDGKSRCILEPSTAKRDTFSVWVSRASRRGKKSDAT